MSLEIGSFVVWSVWADQYWHLCFSWTWWQGGELEHQWRLRVLSQRNCCGVVDVGLLEVVVHSWSRRFIICGVVALCAAEREMRPLCIILQHCAIRRRREDWADTPSHKSFYISPHIKMYLYCLSLPICHIPLDTLQYFFFFFFYYSFPDCFFFIPQRDLIMFWIKLHMWIMSEKCSMTNCRRWAQLAGNWATSSWRGLARVEIDGLMDRSGG